MAKLSRRQISSYIANRLAAGDAEALLSRQLAAYLIETKRTNDTELLLRDIQYHLAQQGRVSGTVTTAYALSAATKKSLEAYAKKVTGAQKVHLDSKVDPTVLGGIRLALPGVQLDTTIARQLTALKTEYKKA